MKGTVHTYYKIRPIGDKAYCVIHPSEVREVLQSWLDGMNYGDELVVSQIDLTDEEFEKMPEYEG